ncbi:hypothetical protein RHOSPDRAFT_27897 [Rhodotorula sp. JG-1b]|nr:hypothetical protein RHOSPDRAFT_27897 [Rhodotorula sp. JG-1b]
MFAANMSKESSKQYNASREAFKRDLENMKGTVMRILRQQAAPASQRLKEVAKQLCITAKESEYSFTEIAAKFGWHSKPQPQEQANTADEFARKIMHAEDPKNVDLPSNALKADESKQYATMRNMLTALITLNVCGEMRSSQGELTRDTNKVLINEAQAGLADDLWRWRERCKALLKEWRYDTVHKAQPWHVWLRRLGERVVAVSHTWNNNKKEGIRQAAQIIASLSPFLPFTLLWLTFETPRLAKTSEQIRQEVEALEAQLPLEGQDQTNKVAGPARWSGVGEPILSGHDLTGQGQQYLNSFQPNPTTIAPVAAGAPAVGYADPDSPATAMNLHQFAQQPGGALRGGYHGDIALDPFPLHQHYLSPTVEGWSQPGYHDGSCLPPHAAVTGPLGGFPCPDFGGPMLHNPHAGSHNSAGVPHGPMLQADNLMPMHTSSTSSPCYVHLAQQNTHSRFRVPSSQYPQAVSDGARVVPQTSHQAYGLDDPAPLSQRRRVRMSKL